MLNFIKNFRNDEDGAVTVDFVVLTAAIVLLGLAVGAAIQSGARGLAINLFYAGLTLTACIKEVDADAIKVSIGRFAKVLRCLGGAAIQDTG